MAKKASRPVYIYGLKDPRSGLIRYIGKTVSLEQRLAAHLASKKRATHKARWIAGLVRAGLKPEMVVLEVTDDKHWEAREKYWIKRGRESDWPLTNVAEGGHTNLFSSGDTFEDLLLMFVDDEGQRAIIRRLDEATQRAIAWEAAKQSLPYLHDIFCVSWGRDTPQNRLNTRVSIQETISLIERRLIEHSERY